MSRLISRILLTVFMLPLAALVYTTVFVVGDRIALFGTRNDAAGFVYTGLIVWALVAVYWVVLWGGGVRWNVWRVNATWLAAVGSAVAAGLIALSVRQAYQYGTFYAFVGSAFAPMFWLVATVYLWRETQAERAGRLRQTGGDTLVCPACGYNLTGLSEPRCPECGARFTLGELFARQPARERSAAESEMTA